MCEGCGEELEEEEEEEEEERVEGFEPKDQKVSNSELRWTETIGLWWSARVLKMGSWVSLCSDFFLKRELFEEASEELVAWEHVRFAAGT